MHTAVRREIFFSVLLMSVFSTCVSGEQEESSPKVHNTVAPVRLDAWQVVYSRNSANHRGTRKAQEAGDISPRMDRVIKDSKVHSSENEAAEEGSVEGRKDEVNVGEYCGHYCLCWLLHRHY
jgi:hypothetical protein